MSLSRLVAPLAYLRVQHPTKSTYDWRLPLAGALVAWAAAMFAGVRTNVFAEYGIVHGANQLLQILVGFYVAALAAVATFQSARMDELTSGDPLKLGNELLTRRRFICLLYGHLGVVGFALYLVGVGAMAVAPGLKVAIGDATIISNQWIVLGWAETLRCVFALLHLFVLSHLFITTLYGVYYLAVRMHNIPPRAEITKPVRPAPSAPDKAAA